MLAGDTSLSSSSADIATSQSASEGSLEHGSPADLVSLVDDDELTLLCREVEDLKRYMILLLSLLSFLIFLQDIY